MRTKHRSTQLFTVASLLSAVGLAAAGLAVQPVAGAHADEGTPPPPSSGERVDHLLERCREREREWLSTQADNLTRAGEALAEVQSLIQQAKERGIDTAELEALLARAYGYLGTAQSEHSQAAAILAGHAGFDDSGAVIDRDQARATCLDARQALHDGRQAVVEIRETGVEMRELVWEW